MDKILRSSLSRSRSLLHQRTLRHFSSNKDADEDVEATSKVNPVTGDTKAKIKAPFNLLKLVGGVRGFMLKPLDGIRFSNDSKKWNAFDFWWGERNKMAKFLQAPKITVSESNGVMRYFVPLGGYKIEDIKVTNLGRSMKVHCESDSEPIGNRVVTAELFYPKGDRKLHASDFRVGLGDENVFVLEVYYYTDKAYDVTVNDDRTKPVKKEGGKEIDSEVKEE